MMKKGRFNLKKGAEKMKKLLLIVLSLVGAQACGITYYDALTSTAPVTTAATTITYPKTAGTAGMIAPEINPVYADSIAQLKLAVPTIVGSAKILVPKLIALGTSAAAGDVGGFVGGTVSFATDSKTRNAIVDLTKVVIATIKTTIKLANADPSTKRTVKDLLSALTQDKDVAKVIALSQKVPVVGKDLHDKLQELINKATTY